MHLQFHFFIGFYVVVLFYTFGSFLFYKGFLPNSEGKSDSEKQVFNSDIVKKNKVSSKFDRLIFILIDALRADFVYTKKNQDMFLPFLQNKISTNSTFSYISKGNSPTVTMPRIKGITSGSIPSFHEVLMNAASKEFSEDNILNSFQAEGLRMTFFGDDTWIKLFPKHFIRYDGTQSFYVNDYTEVDDNVTRHLPKELSKSDWDVMILHYLGLDHIGHTVGPYDPLIGKKLLEMDAIIERIYNNTKHYDLKHGTKSLIFVTGDHGMSNAGSHGGASTEELNTPCIFLSSHYNGEMFKNIYVQQVDIAVTLAMLFGVRIPSNSIGKPIPLVYMLHGASGITSINIQVACQLYNLGEKTLHPNMLRRLKDVCRNVTGNNKVTDEASALLSALSSEYIDNYMIVGLFIMILMTILVIIILLYLSQYSDIQPRKFVSIYPVCIMVLSLLSLSSSSMVEEEHYLYYYFVPSFIIGLTLTKNNNIAITIMILTLLRLICGWNRTGVQWSGLYDIEDYLNQHTMVMFISILFGTLIIVFIAKKARLVKEALVVFIILITFPLLVIKFCSKNDNELPIWVCSKDIVLYAERLVYAGSIVLMLTGICKTSMKMVKLAWTVLSLLLLRPTNFPWFCLLVVTEYIVSTHLVPQLLADKVLHGTSIFYLFHGLGKLSYFAQSNSNNFSTVDISSGIIGLREYDPIFSILISFIGTFTSEFLWYFSLKSCLDNSKARSLSLYICIYQMIELTFFSFVVYFMRYHLFIWSVFAPKYLYMVVESLVKFFVLFPLMYIT